MSLWNVSGALQSLYNIPQELIHSHATHRKGGVLLGVLGHLDLPKPRFQVHGGEELGAYHKLHGLLHMGKGVCILLGLAI